ncbi:hypothetical protein CY34DRAFT_811964 [Suillus luteus UH-Slu-Lm8-n1]|uniref:Uncharacterized protein n=1 Tax=Suillus luteus UH-Slu-Lm8-n1 TaxID=930992 RepID=A0A0D0AC59_9AGAM|nr:hypothetical protein CY34DRAFT_811964 [Suillus luteus UH-Slu-Lm8-n1]
MTQSSYLTLGQDSPFGTGPAIPVDSPRRFSVPSTAMQDAIDCVHFADEYLSKLTTVQYDIEAVMH